ncbi:MAG TPA: peptide ABC transporter substrate-binding protein, partial [Gammaproteobacteria bacterium]|nr:peptide ABC transporter substrate-binding protein [Gammaproteobacteria bacterium]HPI95040.1 peptide ABC transporter substrate-binding protein [Gammaproteobacteria bacterium]
FTSDSHFNFYKYSNENFDTIIEQIKNTDNLSMKQQLTENAENILLHDLPVIPLYYYVSRHLVNTKIAGFEDNVADRHLSKYLHEKED